MESKKDNWEVIEKETKRLSLKLSKEMLRLVEETIEWSSNGEGTGTYENLKNAFLLLDMVNLIVQKGKQIPEKLINELKDKINNLQVK